MVELPKFGIRETRRVNRPEGGTVENFNVTKKLNDNDRRLVLDTVNKALTELLSAERDMGSHPDILKGYEDMERLYKSIIAKINASSAEAGDEHGIVFSSDEMGRMESVLKAGASNIKRELNKKPFLKRHQLSEEQITSLGDQLNNIATTYERLFEEKLIPLVD